MMFNHAFISYGRADSKKFATKLYNSLIEKRYQIWFDQNDLPLAVNFQEQIKNGIAKADNFLFIIAPHSVNSPYCLKEINLALKYHKRIIPLLHVEQISYKIWQERNPQGTREQWHEYQAKGYHSIFPNMHPEIGKINWVYFREDVDDFEIALAGLIDTFKKHEDYVRQHTEILNQALEWESQNKPTRYLLIGEERKAAEDWLKIRFKDEQPPCQPSDLHCEFICESIKNANNLMTQVFLAYAEADAEAMQQVRNLLWRAGFTVWTSETDVPTGESFESAIKRGIEQADNLVYLLSPESEKSAYCYEELNYALSLNKRIIPILVKPTPGEKIKPELRELQYIDISDRLESKLIKILQHDAAYYEEYKILLAKALKWERQQNNPSILLRGYNLRSAEAWFKVAKKRQKHLPNSLQEKFLNASLQQPPVSSLDVFISYSRVDSDFARQLNDALQLQGKTTWFDQESIATGADFQQEIYRGIESCDNFLFILSPRAVNSAYCADEVEYAAKLHKRFVTILYQPVKSADLHPELAKVQWIDFNQQDGDFNANFNQLVRTLDTDREYVRSHTKWAQRALEWDGKGKISDLLLRGSEFAIAYDWWQQAKNENKQPPITRLQEEFIAKSREYIEAGKKQEKRRVLVLRSALLGVSMALVAAVGLGMMAFNLYQEAKEQTNQAEIQTKEAQKLAKIANFRADAYEIEKLIEVEPVESLVRTIDAFGKSKDQPELQDLLHLTKFNLHRSLGLVRERNIFQGHKDTVFSVVFSPDGKTILSGSEDNTVRLWDLKGNLIAKPFTGHKSWVRAMAFSPDSQRIVTGSDDKTIQLWDRKGNPIGKPFQGHKDTVISVAFSPDGKTIVSGSFDKTIRLWDLKGNPVAQPFTGHEDYITSVAFSPDGKTIASGSFDKTIRLWDLKGNPVGQPFIGHQGYVMSLAFSPDGQTIVSGSADNTVRLWDLKGKSVGQPFVGHSYWVGSVAFSPDGQTVVSGSWDKTIILWDLKGNPIGQPFINHQDRVMSVSFSPDGKTILSGGADKTVRLWNREENFISQVFSGYKDDVRSVVFSPDGKTIASGSADKTIRLWDISGNPIGKPLIGHQNEVLSVAFSPDSQTIASGSADKTIRLWDIKGNPIGKPFMGHQDMVLSVAFSPDGQTIVSGSADKTLRLWDLEGNQVGQPFLGHQNWVTSVVFSPDGKKIVSGSDDQVVQLWDLKGNPISQPFKGHRLWVKSAAFSPNGKTIVSGSGDNTVRLWDLEGNPIGKPFSGHQGYVMSVAFSPDGKTVVSGSADKTVRLWDLEGNPLSQPFKDHQHWVTSVAFSPDGKTIVSGSRDKTVRLWHDVTWQAWLDKGCNQLRLHPIFVYPEPELAEISQGAVETCIDHGAWTDKEIAEFRVQQGRALASFKADVSGAIEKFKQAKKLDKTLDLQTLEKEAKQLAIWKN